MHPWQRTLHKHPRPEFYNSQALLFVTTMQQTFDNQPKGNATIAMKPGFLETSEEYVSMQPFKDHPRGLTAYEAR